MKCAKLATQIVLIGPAAEIWPNVATNDAQHVDLPVYMKQTAQEAKRNTRSETAQHEGHMMTL